MLDEYMTKYGYTDREIQLIRQAYTNSNYTESNILYNLKILIDYLKQNNLTNNEIIFITTTLPSIICKSIDLIKKRVIELTKYKYNKIDIFNIIKLNPYILIIPITNIDNKINLLKNMGFQIEDIKNIFLHTPTLINNNDKVIINKYNYLKKFGYNLEDIINIFKENPVLINTNNLDITHIIRNYTKLGLGKKSIIKITSCIPALLNKDIEFLKTQLNRLYKYGFHRDEIIKMITEIPMLLKEEYINSIEEKLKKLEKIFASHKNTIEIIEKNPYILLHPEENIKFNFKLLKEFKFNERDINSIIVRCPIIICYNINTLKEKLSFYKKIKTIDKIIDTPEILTYNLDLIKNRYEIISKINIDNKYIEELFRKEDIPINDLFINDQDFYHKYNLTRERILQGGK